MIKSMTVRRVKDEGHRVLLFGSRDDYHVIAPCGTDIAIGQEIRYEPYGMNFGFHVATGEQRRDDAKTTR